MHGLVCRCESDDKVRIGMNVPSKHRCVVRRRVGEDAEGVTKRKSAAAKAAREAKGKIYYIGRETHRLLD